MFVHKINSIIYRKIAAKYILILLVTYLLGIILVPIWESEVYLAHTVFELICVLLSISTFLLVWNTYDKAFILNHFIGFGFLSVAIFDIFHIYYFWSTRTLGQGYPDLSARYWIIGRLVEAMVLMVSSVGSDCRRLNKWVGLIVVLLGSFGTAFIILIFPGIMPIMLTNDGLTPIKIALEYIVVFLTLISLYIVRKKLADNAIISYKDMYMALLLIIPAELCFTLFTVVTSFYSTYGHILKIVYYYYLYKAVFVNAITNPYNQSEERNRSIIAAMAEGVVFHGSNGNIISCNASAEHIFGLKSNQMIGKIYHPTWKVVHEDFTPFPEETHPAVITLRTGVPQLGVNMGIYQSDEMLIWISMNSEPLFRPDEEKPYGAVVTFVDITMRKIAEERLREKAETDHLTKIANRRHFDHKYQEQYDQMSKAGKPLSVIMADIDLFKQYNDLYGHQQGDQCLKVVAETLQTVFCSEDCLLARYGGEEFVVVVQMGLERSLEFSEQARQAIEQRNCLHSRSPFGRITCSFGVASVSALDSPEFLLRRADEALYQAKAKGRNCVRAM